MWKSYWINGGLYNDMIVVFINFFENFINPFMTGASIMKGLKIELWLLVSISLTKTQL